MAAFAVFAVSDADPSFAVAVSAVFAVFVAADPSFAVAVSAVFAVFAAADPLFAD